MKKRGYFFTLDAFIAMGVITIGLMLMLLTYQSAPYETESVILADEMLGSLANTKLTEINYPFISDIIENGTVNQKESTLLEQIGEFYARDMSGTAKEVAEVVMYNSTPPQYGSSIWIDNVLIFNTSIEKSESKALSSSKMLVMGLVDEENSWGPYSAEVRVWLQ